MQKAFDAVPEDNTETEIVLLKNVSENIIVKENQNIILELNGKTITNVEGTASEGDWNQATVEVYGNLEVKNGKIEGIYGNAIENYSGIVKINAEIIGYRDYPTVYNNDGTVSIIGGTVIAENSNAIYNEGDLSISGGEIVGQSDEYPTLYDDNIEYDNTINISGGTIKSTSSWRCIYLYGNATVNISEDAVIYNEDIREDSSSIYVDGYGTLNINGGIISGNCGRVIEIDYGNMNILNGKIIATDDNVAIWNDRCTNLIINGGSVISENGYALYTPSAAGQYSTEINGGTFTNNSDYYATVYDFGYYLTISAGTIINNGNYYGLELRDPEDTLNLLVSDDAIISSKNF